MSYLPLEINQLINVRGRLLRTMCIVCDTQSYFDRVACLPDNPGTQLIGVLFKWLDNVRWGLTRFECKTWKAKEGEKIPKWTLSYLIFLLHLNVSRISIQIDRELL